MSLLIGCILIYHYDLGWWWYAVAAGWYWVEWQRHWDYYSDLQKRLHELRGEIESLKPPIDHDYD
jgi:hypothetical protein